MDGLITYEDAVGLPPLSAPSAASGGPAPAPAAAEPDIAFIDPATVLGKPKASAGASAAPAAMPPLVLPSKPTGFISYEDATAPETPHVGGILSNAPDDGVMSSTLKGVGTTLLKGAGHIPGLFGDAMDLGDYLIARAQSKITGKPLEAIQADQVKARKADWTDPRNYLPSGAEVSEPDLKALGEYKPTSTAGKLAMAGGEAAIGGLTFGGGAGVAGLNALGGASGQAVTDVTGDPLYGLAAGGLVPGGAEVASAAARKVATPVIMGVPGIDAVPVIGPRVTTTRDNAAAARVVDAASDPAALRTFAATPASPSEVPASPRTLAGAVGNDRGLFQAEKDARNVDNLPFNALDRAQSDAQQDAIRGAADSGANVFRPGQVIRQRLDAIDAASQAAADRLQAAHHDAVTQQRADLQDRTIARGQASADQKAASDAAAQAAHENLVQSFADAHAQASQAAADASAPLRSLPTADVVGDTLRTAQQEATDAAKAERQRLYDLVPDHATIVATPVKQAKADIAGAIDPHTGVQPSGAEAAIWGDIDRLPPVVPFRSLQTLDSRVTAAMADARRNPNPNDPQAIGRLTQLKSSVMDAIENGAENQAAHEAQLVQAGAMPAEDTLQARLGASLQQEADAFRTARARATGSDSGTGASDATAGRSFRVSGFDGSEVQGRGGLSDAEGAAGVSAPAPAFDQAAADALAAAKAGHRDYKTTFDNKTVAPVLADNGFRGQYTMPAGAVPSRYVTTGPKGYETARAFLAATNAHPAAIQGMRDTALAGLRKNMPPIGTLHPNALARWKAPDQYGGALRALDEVSPGFSSVADNAAAATQAVLDLGIRQKAEAAEAQRAAAKQAVIDNLQRRDAAGQANQADRAQVDALLKESAATTRAGIAQAHGIARDARATPAGQFLGQGGDRVASSEVENAVGSMLRTGTAGATRMRSLVASVAKDGDAVEGLRKAGVDWMLRTFQNQDGAMSGAKFISFLRDNKDTLKELYPTAQVSMFGAIARDLEANARWRTETAIKGGSDTAKNLPGVVGKAVEEGKKHVSIGAAAAAGYWAGGLKGAAAGAGLFLLNSLRSAGIRSVEDLYREALLDPEKARYLISKMPERVEGGKLRALAGVLRRELVVGPQAMQDHARAR